MFNPVTISVKQKGKAEAKITIGADERGNVEVSSNFLFVEAAQSGEFYLQIAAFIADCIDKKLTEFANEREEK